MNRKAMTQKLLILGVDGMDPRLTRKFVDEGKMPNVKKYIEKGSCRKDLVLLGGHPTITPPMWTTLSTGCYATVHGITCLSKQSPTNLAAWRYTLDSRFCKAEHLWNVTTEAGKKTLVFHWPGCSWPPTTDSENLFVVDGTAPGSVNMGVAQREDEFILVADEKFENLLFKAKSATNANEPCIITDLDINNDTAVDDATGGMTSPGDETDHVVMIMDETEGQAGLVVEAPKDIVQSPITSPKNWAVEPPEGAKEFILLLSGGLLRRPCQILKNENGLYDRVAIYKSKKETSPMIILKKGEMQFDLIDECIGHHDKKYTVSRYMKVIDLKEDGSYIRMWISAAMDVNYDETFSPKSIYKEIVDNCGQVPPTALFGNHDPELVACTRQAWYRIADWQSSAINYFIDKKDIEVVFSHFHAVDLEEHRWIRFLTDKGHNVLPEEEYFHFMEELYIQTDYYLGKFLDRLDEGWTIFIVSDHAQVCPKYEPVGIGDATGVNVGLMRKLGFTAVKQAENGNDLREIDWTKTKAIAVRGNNIYINYKGKYDHGIVDPKDQWEVEEEIITALYGYRHPKTGRRVISIALRNRDAVLLGYSGPEVGDIVYWVAEGYNFDHGDSLSTTLGEKDTSVSPIFIAAGSGIKENYYTDRMIRQIDVTPTAAALLGTRMPLQCEGAPVYQIFDEEF